MSSADSEHQPGTHRNILHQPELWLHTHITSQLPSQTVYLTVLIAERSNPGINALAYVTQVLQNMQIPPPRFSSHLDASNLHSTPLCNAATACSNSRSMPYSE